MTDTKPTTGTAGDKPADTKQPAKAVWTIQNNSSRHLSIIPVDKRIELQNGESLPMPELTDEGAAELAEALKRYPGVSLKKEG